MLTEEENALLTVWESLLKKDGWIWESSDDMTLAIGAIIGDWAGVEQLAAEKATNYRESHRQRLPALVEDFKMKLH
jgi:hypothetical protein